MHNGIADVGGKRGGLIFTRESGLVFTGVGVNGRECAGADIGIRSS